MKISEQNVKDLRIKIWGGCEKKVLEWTACDVSKMHGTVIFDGITFDHVYHVELLKDASFAHWVMTEDGRIWENNKQVGICKSIYEIEKSTKPKVRLVPKRKTPKVKPMEFDFVKLNSGNYFLRDFRNIMTKDELKANFGHDIYEAYYASDKFVYHDHGKVVLVKQDGNHFALLERTKIWTVKDYEEILEFLRGAGSNLANIIEASKKNFIKVII